MRIPKHTPGPWERLVHQTPDAIYISDRATNEIARIPKGHDTSMPNARLIATAPELLEALRYAVQDLEDLLRQTGASSKGISLKAFKNTIAKATGGAE